MGTIEIKLEHSNGLNSWAWPVNGETCQHVFQTVHSLGATDVQCTSALPEPSRVLRGHDTDVQCTSALPEPSRVLRGHDGDGQQAAAGRPGHGVPITTAELNGFLLIPTDFY